jgi:hypothetical protein
MCPTAVLCVCGVYRVEERDPEAPHKPQGDGELGELQTPTLEPGPLGTGQGSVCVCVCKLNITELLVLLLKLYSAYTHVILDN